MRGLNLQKKFGVKPDKTKQSENFLNLLFAGKNGEISVRRLNLFASNLTSGFENGSNSQKNFKIKFEKKCIKIRQKYFFSNFIRNFALKFKIFNPAKIRADLFTKLKFKKFGLPFFTADKFTPKSLPQKLFALLNSAQIYKRFQGAGLGRKKITPYASFKNEFAQLAFSQSTCLKSVFLVKRNLNSSARKILERNLKFENKGANFKLIQTSLLRRNLTQNPAEIKKNIGNVAMPNLKFNPQNPLVSKAVGQNAKRQNINLSASLAANIKISATIRSQNPNLSKKEPK